MTPECSRLGFRSIGLRASVRKIAICHDRDLTSFLQPIRDIRPFFLRIGIPRIHSSFRLRIFVECLAQVERDANTYIGAASQSREGNEPFFGVSRRRPLRDGQFSGIIMISIAPKTFSDFYRELAGDTTARP